MFCIWLSLVAQLAAPSTLPDSSVGPDIIYYGGKRVVFYAKREEVVLLDSAWVRYRNMSVFSDSIHYDVRLHRLTAHRDVLFTSGTENITGSHLLYDVDTRKGMMHGARTQVQNGYFRAEEVWLVRERVLNARRASYTTCDHDNPHYCFYGPRVKLEMDDAAIAEPVLFKLGPVPVLTAPFWLVPVASRRKSGLMPFKVGNSSYEGLYAKAISYYWVINDYADATFSADVMTRKGVQGGFEGVYVVNPFATGNVVAAYVREWDTGRHRYSVNATHASPRFFLGSEFSANADLVSDASYVADYSDDRLDWLKRDSRSNAALSRSLGRLGRLSLRAERYENFAQHWDYSILPAARMSFGAQPLGAGWTLSPSLSATNRSERWADSTGADTALISRRDAGLGYGVSSPQYGLGSFGALSINHGLSLNGSLVGTNGIQSGRSLTAGHNLSLSTDQRFWGTGQLTEQLSLNQTDNLVDTIAPSAGYTAGVQSRLSLFRVFGTTAFGLHGLLHTVTPTAGISYSPAVEPGGIFGRPDFGTPDQARINLGLANSFQAKLDTAGTKRDLGSLNFGAGYDLIQKRTSPLTAALSFQPLQGSDLNLTFDAGAAFDLESLRLNPNHYVNSAFNWSRMKTDTATKLARGITLGLRHTLAPGANMLTGRAELAGWGWKLSVGSVGYNFETRQFANYDITLLRDLHCWEALVSYKRLGTSWNYDFLIRIKALPDLRIGRSTFGSLLPGP